MASLVAACDEQAAVSDGGSQEGESESESESESEGEGNWRALPVEGAPSPRASYAVVWTGSEMVVWGGADDKAVLGDGARYNPDQDAWTPITSSGAPEPRVTSGVWSGAEMIIWSGSDGDALSTGGRYDPLADAWTPTSIGPVGRAGPARIWTGSEMIIWGSGDEEMFLEGGYRYNPATDSWATIAADAEPTPRGSCTAVWTGSEMIIWGGTSGDYSGATVESSGGRYDPIADTWAPMSDSPLEERYWHSAVWTGSEMIVWGGNGPGLSIFDDGARYDPVTDLWAEMSDLDAPVRRFGHVAVWTGSEMLIWGGVGTISFPTGGGTV
jgi:hypothetical protein